MNLFELPVDQFQRYRIATDIINALRGEKPMRVLEVGGYPPRLGDFLPDDQVVVTDLTRSDDAGYVRADALDLPFGDKSFDAVVALDVLEHIPPDDRETFTAELSRVSESFVVIAAPFDDGKGLISGAEKLLKELIGDAHGYEHQYFEEHLKYGLPNIGNTIDYFHRNDWKVHTLPNGYFPRWFAIILAEYTIINKEIHEVIMPKLREYYNYHYYKADNREPAYRHVVVAGREIFSDTQRNALSGLTASPSDVGEWPPLEYAATLVELARLNLTADIENRIAGLEHNLAAREEEIQHLEKYTGELEEFADKIKGSLPYRLYSLLLKK